MTTDGAMYRFLGNGEYYLLFLPELSFEVQIRIISCYSSGSCVNAIAVNASGNVVMIHGRYSLTENPVVYINGKRSLSLSAEIGSKQDRFVLQRVSYLRYKLSNRYGVRLDIRLYDRYMDIVVGFKNTTYCLNNVGLLGNCNGNHSDDFNSKDGFFVTGFNITQNYIYEVYGPSWKVSNANSLFEYDWNDYHEQQNLNGGEYALYFNNTGIHTNQIYSFSASDISIELMVKLIESDGVILSYTTTETFAITVQSRKIILQYADKTLDTYITLDLNKYYQMAIVWAHDYQIVQLYFTETDGTLHSRNFPLKSDVFEPGGLLALGYWAPSPTGHGKLPSRSFIGEIDELRLWNQKLSMSAVSSNWRRNLDCRKIPGLASLWKFNEGQGNFAHDCISGADFVIPESIWRSVRWVYSNAHIPLFSYGPIVAHLLSFTPSPEIYEAESKCSDVIYSQHLMKNCTFLTNSSLQLYHASCVYTVTRTGNLNDAYWIAMTIADMCSSTFPVGTWPASSFCKEVNRLNFPDWIGTSCASYCQYGLRGNSDVSSCHCIKGYYGNSCSLQCPGGYLSPCNGFSETCDLTGHCQCPVTANKSRDCSDCDEGWLLKDCSVAVVNESLSLSHHCQGFGSGYYVSFDGVHYRFKTYGEYYIINTPHLSAQARQIPCGESFCISSIAVKTTGRSFTIRASLTKTGTPLLWIDGSQSISTHAILDGNYIYHKVSPNIFEITNNQTLSSLNSLKIKSFGKYLSFELVAAQNMCRKETGLCSSCDNNPTNDLIDTTGQSLWGKHGNQSMLSFALSKRWQVPSEKSLFIFNTTSYHEQRKITLSGYCLSFDGTIAYTNSLVGIFNGTKDFTIQVFIIQLFFIFIVVVVIDADAEVAVVVTLLRTNVFSFCFILCVFICPYNCKVHSLLHSFQY